MFESPPFRQRQEIGFTLIEVLVALVVLAIGLLGYSTLMLNGLKQNDSAQLRSQATLYAHEITERIRANRDAAVNYTAALQAFGDLSSPDASIAQIDRYDWYRKLDAELPSFQGAINCSAAICIITVQWDDARAENSVAAVNKQIILAGQL